MCVVQCASIKISLNNLIGQHASTMHQACINHASSMHQACPHAQLHKPQLWTKNRFTNQKI